MSIYASIPGIGDPGDDDALGQPWIYQGSHVLPADDDPRGGSISLAIIPSHITRDGRDDQPEDGRPWPWLRLSVDTDTDDPTVLLNPAQARHHGAQLTAWADEAAPHPAPDSLRERYVALFRHAPGELRLGDEPPEPIADAVLAVRDEEVARLRAELVRMQEAGDHHIGAAERERDQLRTAVGRVRRLCDLTIAASVRVQAVQQAKDTLAALDGAAEETTTEVAQADRAYWGAKYAEDTDPQPTTEA